MALPAAPPDDEVTRLQRCINDLISVLAFPAMWTGRSPRQIVDSFLDGLLRILQLDVAYVHLADETGEPAETLRVAHGAEPDLTRASELFGTFGEDLSRWPRQITFGSNGLTLSIEPLHLGLDALRGMVVVGAQRAEFPLQTETLLLNVAANQLMLALQEAHLRLEQQRMADEADRRVAERTAQLASLNAVLENSEARLRRVIDTIPNIAWCNLPTGPNEYLNRAWHEYTGLTPEESQGWAWQSAMHPDDLPPLLKRWGELMVTGESGEIEGRFRRHDGVYRWFLIRAQPFLDENGEIARWYGTSTDIDDRKRAEEALLASQREFIQIVNMVPALVWSARPDGSAEFFSDSYIAYVGMTAEQLLPWGWMEIIHPDDLHALVEVWEAIRDTPQPAGTEARLRRHDGEYRWFLFRANPVLDTSGNVVKWYGINTDIDDRKRAEDQLRRSEAFLAEGQNLARIGNFSWLTTTDEMKWSEQLYRIFEFESDTRVTLELFASRVHPEDRSPLDDLIGAARRAGSDLEYSCRLLMQTGAIKHLQLVAHATRDSQGRLEYIGAVQDVTQRRTADEALSAAKTELANIARMTSLGVLTAAIAHEVNQPISGIITNASTCLRMLSGQPPNITGALETARRTIRDGNRASDVIARLRSLYTRKGVEPEPMDLNEAAQEVVSLWLSELQRNGVVLRNELSERLPLVQGDRIQLQQVILNLLRNALDAMRAVHDRPRDLVVRTAPDGTDVRLSVIDTGVGFSAQDFEKVFAPFHTTKNDGMGIGLSVSRSIIEAHRGRLWATPNDGPGVTFTFSLPVHSSDFAAG
jgi:PAS domain S-box-containing protein